MIPLAGMTKKKRGGGKKKSAGFRNEFWDEISERARDIEASLAQKRNPEPDFELIRAIELAFRGVTCLREENVLLCTAAREDVCFCDSPSHMRAVMQDLQRREERRDWSRIPPALLLACEEGLPYLGTEAFRFLMPAYMMLDLKYHPDEVLGSMRLAGMSGILTTSSPETVAFFTQRFADFSPRQKETVSLFFSWWRHKLRAEYPDADGESVLFLPWEYEDFRKRGDGFSPFEYFGLAPTAAQERL